MTRRSRSSPSWRKLGLVAAISSNDLKRYHRRFSAYDNALTLKPDLAEAWLGRGNIFAELKRYDEAFSAYDKALALKSDLAEAWLGRGNIFAELKRYDEKFSCTRQGASAQALFGYWQRGRSSPFQNASL